MVMRRDNFYDYYVYIIFLYTHVQIECYVIFLYKGSMYTRYEYIYYVYVEVYVNLQLEVMKIFKFSMFLTCECNDVN